MTNSRRQLMTRDEVLYHIALSMIKKRINPYLIFSDEMELIEASPELSAKFTAYKKEISQQLNAGEFA